MSAADHTLDQSPEDDAEVFVFPASFAQSRLWFIEQLAAANTAYTITRAVELRGNLDPAVLEKALAAICARHEILRTTFANLHGEPHQVVHPELTIPLDQYDLSAIAASAQEERLQALIGDLAAKPFDLQTGPLLRVALVKLAPAVHALITCMHHIIGDGWSTGVFIRELGMAAEAIAEGTEPSFPPLDIQYADYAEWQREWMQGEALETQLAFWREQMAGVPPILELPIDLPRPRMQSNRGATLIRQLPQSLAAKLNELCRAEQATIFMALEAAFAALLQRYTNQDDIVIGTPVANRARPELEALIGFFVNTVMIRNDLSGTPSFRELLRRTRATTLGAFSNQDVPFEKIVEELRPERTLSHTPLFQVMFVLQNAVEPTRQAQARPGGLTMQPLAIPADQAKFDLLLEVAERPEGLFTAWEYTIDLFRPTTIARFAAVFEALLTAIVADPDAPLATLRLGHESEGEEQSVTANPALPVQALFSAQAARTPGHIAIADDERTLSYAELDQRSNQLAHALIAQGAGPERFVGLLLERSIEAVTTILAILKTGAAYAPLDPTAPRERLATMLTAINPVTIITTPELKAHLPENAAVTLYSELERGDHPKTAPQTTAGPDSPAYIMYTSGSTGEPKGIIVPHRAIVRLVTEPTFAQLDAATVMGLFAPLAFDASTLELWGPLLNGGRIAVIPPGQLAVEELAQQFVHLGVTTMWLTAGLFHQMVEYYPNGLRPLHQVLAGGDILSPSLVRKVLETLPQLTLINGYGPTENTTFTCCCKLDLDVLVGASVPIGRPINNTQVYLLDDHGQPVLTGAIGELYAGGAGLAHGYLGRPDLTAERFVPNPFATTPGERLYRTGDLARRRDDGLIEFWGRRDGQVKIRGFRIELGEIEAVLHTHPALSAAAVIARDDLPGGRALVAYIVLSNPEQAPTLDALRAHMATQLPDYMIPAHLVVLEHLPLNANGKVDRRALPTPARMALSTRYVAPATPTEEALAAIWAQLLHADRVGSADSFFALGGHSLLATQLVSQIRAQFQVELPLRQIFETPTIAALATQIDALQRAQAATPPSLEELLDTLEGMSDEEAAALFAHYGIDPSDLA